MQFTVDSTENDTVVNIKVVGVGGGGGNAVDRMIQSGMYSAAQRRHIKFRSAQSSQKAAVPAAVRSRALWRRRRAAMRLHLF